MPVRLPCACRATAQDGSELVFRIMKAADLQTVFTSFERAKGAKPGTYSFILGGVKLRAGETASACGMVDGSVVTAHYADPTAQCVPSCSSASPSGAAALRLCCLGAAPAQFAVSARPKPSPRLGHSCTSPHLHTAPVHSRDRRYQDDGTGFVITMRSLVSEASCRRRRAGERSYPSGSLTAPSSRSLCGPAPNASASLLRRTPSHQHDGKNLPIKIYPGTQVKSIFDYFEKTKGETMGYLHYQFKGAILDRQATTTAAALGVKAGDFFEAVGSPPKAPAGECVAGPARTHVVPLVLRLRATAVRAARRHVRVRLRLASTGYTLSRAHTRLTPGVSPSLPRIPTPSHAPASAGPPLRSSCTRRCVGLRAFACRCRAFRIRTPQPGSPFHSLRACTCMHPPTPHLRSRTRQDEDMTMTVSESMIIGEVLKTYHAKKGVMPGTYKLLFDGTLLTAALTVKACGLEEGTVVDVMLEQTGGARCGAA